MRWKAALTPNLERGKIIEEATDLADSMLDFFADRLKVQQREAGVRHDLIDAVFALGGEDDLVRLLARVNALQAFIETADGANLLAGYKRAANILKKEDWTEARSAWQDAWPSTPATRGNGADRRARCGRAARPPRRSRQRNSSGRWRRSPRLRAPDRCVLRQGDGQRCRRQARARLDLLARFRAPCTGWRISRGSRGE